MSLFINIFSLKFRSDNVNFLIKNWIKKKHLSFLAHKKIFKLFILANKFIFTALTPACSSSLSILLASYPQVTLNYFYFPKNTIFFICVLSVHNVFLPVQLPVIHFLKSKTRILSSGKQFLNSYTYSFSLLFVNNGQCLLEHVLYLYVYIYLS